MKNQMLIHVFYNIIKDTKRLPKESLTYYPQATMNGEERDLCASYVDKKRLGMASFSFPGYMFSLSSIVGSFLNLRVYASLTITH